MCYEQFRRLTPLARGVFFLFGAYDIFSLVVDAFPIFSAAVPEPVSVAFAVFYLLRILSWFFLYPLLALPTTVWPFFLLSLTTMILFHVQTGVAGTTVTIGVHLWWLQWLLYTFYPSNWCEPIQESTQNEWPA